MFRWIIGWYSGSWYTCFRDVLFRLAVIYYSLFALLFTSCIHSSVVLLWSWLLCFLFSVVCSWYIYGLSFLTTLTLLWLLRDSTLRQCFLTISSPVCLRHCLILLHVYILFLGCILLFVLSVVIETADKLPLLLWFSNRIFLSYIVETTNVPCSFTMIGNPNILISDLEFPFLLPDFYFTLTQVL